MSGRRGMAEFGIQPGYDSTQGELQHLLTELSKQIGIRGIISNLDLIYVEPNKDIFFRIGASFNVIYPRQLGDTVSFLFIDVDGTFVSVELAMDLLITPEDTYSTFLAKVYVILTEKFQGKVGFSELFINQLLKRIERQGSSELKKVFKELKTKDRRAKYKILSWLLNQNE